MARYMPLICLALMHALVDATAMYIEPLWPHLRNSLKLSESQLSELLSITAVAPNFCQVAFGYIGDRYGSRYLIWLGPLVGALCLCSIGLAPSGSVLGLLLLVGYVGVGSFHPEAAVFAGRVVPEHRTRALSFFMFGGTLGLGVGPMLSGNLVRAWQVSALAWLIPPSVVMILLIQMAARRAETKAKIELPGPSVPLREVWGNRGKLALFLLAVCSLRVVPNAGMTKAIAFTLESRGFKVDVIGNTQSVFLVTGSLGMLLLASHFRRGWERKLMIWSPLTSVPMLIVLSVRDCPYWLMVALLIPAGVAIIGSIPVMVSYSQELFPKGAGLASSLTMGLSWGVGGIIAANLTTYFDQLQKPSLLFASFIPCLVLSGIGAIALPDVVAPMTAESSNQG